MSQIKGIRYPGDDGSEPEDIRDQKADAYAREVEERCARQAKENIQSGKPRRWPWRGE